MQKTNQTWYINGRHLTHAQLVEYKRKQQEAKVEVTAASENEVVFIDKKEDVKEVVAPVVVQEEIIEEPKAESYDSMKFFTLKKLAVEKGMEVTKETKKEDVLAFLKK